MSLLFSAAAAGAATDPEPARADKGMGADMKKARKHMSKKLDKEGWTVYHGCSTDLKKAVQAYYDSLAAGGSSVQTLMATATAANVNTAMTKAKVRAAQEYASLLRSQVEAVTSIKTANAQGGGTVDSDTEMESSLTVKVSELVKGMAPVLTLRRDAGGKTEVQLLYILKHIGQTD